MGLRLAISKLPSPLSEGPSHWQWRGLKLPGVRLGVTVNGEGPGPGASAILTSMRMTRRSLVKPAPAGSGPGPVGLRMKAGSRQRAAPGRAFKSRFDHQL